MRDNQRSPRRASTTPIYDRRQKHSFLRSLAKAILIPLGVYLAILIFGLPALRFQGQYYDHGPALKQYLWCDYLTINGLKRISPPGINQCPLIKFFPL